ARALSPVESPSSNLVPTEQAVRFGKANALLVSCDALQDAVLRSHWTDQQGSVDHSDFVCVLRSLVSHIQLRKRLALSLHGDEDTEKWSAPALIDAVVRILAQTVDAVEDPEILCTACTTCGEILAYLFHTESAETLQHLSALQAKALSPLGQAPSMSGSVAQGPFGLRISTLVSTLSSVCVRTGRVHPWALRGALTGLSNVASVLYRCVLDKNPQSAYIHMAQETRTELLSFHEQVQTYCARALGMTCDGKGLGGWTLPPSSVCEGVHLRVALLPYVRCVCGSYWDQFSDACRYTPLDAESVAMLCQHIRKCTRHIGG
ncbi:hypothetical protein KIPB_007737, partial [Kipferlia bialata]